MIEGIVNIDLPTEIQQLISSDVAWRYLIVPYKKDNNSVTFLTSNIAQKEIIKEELEILTPWSVDLIDASENDLKRLLGRYYRKSGQLESDNFSLEGKNSSDFLLRIINEAKSVGSSDIHIEVYEDQARIRIRIDGSLQEKYTVELEDYPELVNKIKIKSNLNITEKRLPQDGRISFEKFDVRVSILPTLHGEKIVLRILSRDASQIDLDYLGFADNEQKLYLEGVNKPNGIVLISGPTGSGKTYTSLRLAQLWDKDFNEDRIVFTPQQFIDLLNSKNIFQT